MPSKRVQLTAMKSAFSPMQYIHLPCAWTHKHTHIFSLLSFGFRLFNLKWKGNLAKFVIWL